MIGILQRISGMVGRKTLLRWPPAAWAVEIHIDHPLRRAVSSPHLWGNSRLDSACGRRGKKFNADSFTGRTWGFIGAVGAAEGVIGMGQSVWSNAPGRAAHQNSADTQTGGGGEMKNQGVCNVFAGTAGTALSSL